MSIRDSFVYVFAYGSNLHLHRMRERATSAQPIEVGYVNRRRIVFHKRGRDGSAKADAMLTSNEFDRIWGVIYKLNAGDKRLLDGYESLGIGYDEEVVEVVCSNHRTVQAAIYVARHNMIDAALRPFSWYVAFVRQGAIRHALPFCYIRNELSVASKMDPDSVRHHTNVKILEAPL